MKAEKLFKLKGEIALITGSTGGLGSLFAKGLAENGCKVILYQFDRKMPHIN